MFILLEGIKGTATQPGYEGWIPLHSISHDVDTAMFMFRGSRKKKAGEKKDEEEKDSEQQGASRRQKMRPTTGGLGLNGRTTHLATPP